MRKKEKKMLCFIPFFNSLVFFLTEDKLYELRFSNLPTFFLAKWKGEFFNLLKLPGRSNLSKTRHVSQQKVCLFFFSFFLFHSHIFSKT